MAHGLESRVPLLDHPLVELAATIPADVKFKDGTMKHVFKRRRAPLVPARDRRAHRTRWASRCRCTSGCGGPARDFVARRLLDAAALERDLFDNARGARRRWSGEPQFGRKLWGLLMPRALAAARSTTASTSSSALLTDEEDARA